MIIQPNMPVPGISTDARNEFPRWINDQLAETVSDAINIKRKYSAPTDGTDAYTAFNQALKDIGTTPKVIVLSGGVFRFSQSIIFPENITLWFIRGAKITADDGVTVTIKGDYNAGNYVIFDGSGIINCESSSTPYNISQWDGNSIDEKWDKLRSGIVTGLPYTLIIPEPPPGASGTVDVTGTGYYRWELKAPLILNDNENEGIWYCHGAIHATVPMSRMVHFSPSSKVENVDFYNLKIYGGALNAGFAEVGLEFNEGARINFWGQTEIKNVNTAIKITGVGLSESNFDKINADFADHGAGYLVDLAATVREIKFGSIYCETVGQLNQTMIYVHGGNIRGLTIEDVHFFRYPVVSPGDLLIGIHFETTNGSYQFVNIGKAYFSNAGTGIKTSDASGGTMGKMLGLNVGIVAAGFQKNAIDLDYISSAKISNIVGDGYEHRIIVGATAEDVSVDKAESAGAWLTDNGARTKINGLGKESANAETPIDTKWMTGDMVDFTDTGDGTGNGVYVKRRNNTWLKLG